VIVVDDGSTDATAEVASSFAGVNLVRQPNHGPAAARNAGFDASSGAYLAFHDADDMMPPQKLEAQIRHLQRNPDVGLVLARQRVIIEEGAELPFWARGERMAGDPGVGPPNTGEGAPLMSGVMPRSTFERVGPYDPSLPLAEDLDWFFRLAEIGIGVANLDQELLIRRIHSQSLTQDDASSRRLVFEAFRKRIDRRRAAARSR
jgi:glycosyltransferase involved in cell wall biosynthesis